MTPIVLAEIETLLSQKVGLDPSTSSKRIARAVASRQAICGLPDPQAYLTLVRTSLSELEELMEQLVVPETWFFRDRKPFDYLQRLTSEWPSNRRIQLLSVPCSTGEEPYSMAMALLAAGLAPARFAIDAIDISHQSIARAKQGIYIKNSFRGEEWIDRNRYFQQTAGGFELNQSVRSLVNFQQGNALTLLPSLRRQYDIIFCRNLLIYLQQEACDQVLQALDRLLLPGGLLFVGASETGKIDTAKYTSVRQSFTFAFRKLDKPQPLSQAGTGGQGELGVPSGDKGARGTGGEKRDMEAGGAKTRGEKSRRNNKSLPFSPLTPSPPSIPKSSPTLPTDLQTVRKLADEGELAKATELCKTYLSHHPTSAAAYILLGQLYQAAQQDAQAEPCFQKAVYLEPASYEALVHLALLKEHQGDWMSAKVIRQRIQRLQ